MLVVIAKMLKHIYQRVLENIQYNNIFHIKTPQFLQSASRLNFFSMQAIISKNKAVSLEKVEI